MILKRFVVLFSFMGALVAPFSYAEIGRDKYKHFAVSAGLGFAADQILRLASEDELFDASWKRQSLSVGLALVPGFAKEVLDHQKKNNHFSRNDMIANTLGAVTGVLLSSLLPRSWYVSAARKDSVNTVSFNFSF